MPQDLQFLNWYVGVLITLIGLLFSLVVYKAKEEYEDYKLQKTNQKILDHNTREEIKNISSSLEIFREKMIADLSYLKEAVKAIPKLQEQVNRLEIDITRTSEQIKSLQKSLDNVETLGKIIKVKGPQ